MRSSILEALTELERGSALPYATQADGQVVGSTRFGNISRKDRRYEIGWTWLAPRWQRTFVNTETKWLMLNHAFEVLNALRVELKTDALNLQSRNAILRLGATEEGTFRKHLITATGRVRDTVYFSIVADEWPRINAQLKRRLDSNPADRS
jgi:RimJ/RimL family protein N-acetyltransferase